MNHVLTVPNKKSRNSCEVNFFPWFWNHLIWQSVNAHSYSFATQKSRFTQRKNKGFVTKEPTSYNFLQKARDIYQWSQKQRSLHRTLVLEVALNNNHLLRKWGFVEVENGVSIGNIFWSWKKWYENLEVNRLGVMGGQIIV